MQIYNNNQCNMNFTANKLATVTRVGNELSQFEKYEIYRLNEQDILFAKKIIEYMQKYKSRLGEMQKNLYEKLKEFCQNPDLFLNGTDKKENIYIGIKNNESIEGFVSVETLLQGKQNLGNVYSGFNNSPLEGGFIMALMHDKKPYGYNIACGRRIQGWNGFGIKENSEYNAITKIAKEEKIKNLNPDYRFEVVHSQNENHNLEEILDI